jgi:cytochrome c553
MKRQVFLAIGFIALLIISCTSNTETVEEVNKDVVIEQTQLNDDEVAHSLVNNCFSCHLPMGSSEDRIAPLMGHVRNHYLEKYSTKEYFVKAMESYVNSPNKKDAIMYGAIDKFGIMPNMQFDKELVHNIATYLYDYDVSSVNWLKKYNKTTGPTFAADDYLGKGRYIVMTTKKTLGKNLKKTIKSKGTKAAVNFCSINATPILDSMKTVFNADIVRVSNKNRNPDNQSNKKETEYILSYQTQLDNGEDLNPILEETEEQVAFYMPIVTNEMCIQCHGVKENIKPEVLAEIKKHYSNDKAIGYDVNQIRGIWRVKMLK